MVFNNLPEKIQKMSDNVKIFKRMLKKFLTANAFYSMDEYISAKHMYYLLTMFLVIVMNDNVILLVF
jgi:hypothetical protein